jgi:hypothetical protein
MKFDLQSLLKDKNVLYITLFIATMNMFAFLMLRQFDAVIFFTIIGFISTYFSKNMIVVLLAAILSTNFAVSIKMVGKVKEGLTNMKEGKETILDKESGNRDSGDKDSGDKDSGDKKVADPKKNKKKDKAIKGASIPTQKKENFTQQLNPARIDAVDGDDYESNPSVNYAATLESAYDNLDRLLSSEAINNMSEDTHRLAEKQKLLMGNINKLQPMMEKAGSLLNGLDMGSMSDMMEGLSSKLDSFGGKSNKA